jgi:hypothetical protein
MQAISPGNNFNLLCYSLQKSFDSNELEGVGNSLEQEIKLELNKLKSAVQKTLSEGLPIVKNIDSLIPSIFNFRMKVVKWVLKEGINPETLESHSKEAFQDLQALGQSEKYYAFTENLKYALTFSFMLAERIFESEENTEQITEQIEHFDLDYDQAMMTIQMMEPNDKRANKIYEWTRSAMMVEYFTFALYLIAENKLSMNEDTINSLNEVSAKAAQDYVGCMYDLEIALPLITKEDGIYSIDDASIISEQNLADQGLGEDWENL